MVEGATPLGSFPDPSPVSLAPLLELLQGIIAFCFVTGLQELPIRLLFSPSFILHAWNNHITRTQEQTMLTPRDHARSAGLLGTPSPPPTTQPQLEQSGLS